MNKTDKLDARGLNKLQRIGTLPEVWIPPGKLRDKRELTRTRMVLVAQRTQFKNRVHSTLDKYGLKVEVSDLFGKKGRALLARRLPELPPHTRQVTEIMLSQIDLLEERIGAIEERMREVLLPTREVELLQTLPGDPGDRRKVSGNLRTLVCNLLGSLLLRLPYADDLFCGRGKPV